MVHDAAASDAERPKSKTWLWRTDVESSARLQSSRAQIDQDVAVWRDLVSEGRVVNHGYFYHWWADEWNLGIYTIGATLPGILEAVEEAGIPHGVVSIVPGGRDVGARTERARRARMGALGAYAFAFGAGNDIFGHKGWLLDPSAYDFGSLSLPTYFIFQVAFAATAATIVSGAMAEVPLA